MSDGQVRNALGGFRFPFEETDKPVSVLSGGEKSRLALLRILVNPVNLLVLDEPTSHLDLGSREMLENALRNYRGTLLLVSHDIEFIRGVADGILCLDQRGLTRYFGDYDYYMEKRNAESQAEEPLAASEKKRQGGDQRKNRKQRADQRNRMAQKTKPLKKQMQKLENRLEKCHAEREELAGTFQEAGPAVDFSAVNRRLGELESEINKLETEWETAALDLEELENESG